MAWIESHQSLSRHRKTLRAAALLRCDRHKLIGHLHELWWWALDNVPSNGALHGTLDAEIEGGAEWDGEPGAFVDALTRSGFIDVQDDGRFIHDWYEFAGKLLTRREDNRVRQANKRERDRLSSIAASNAHVTRDSRVTSRVSHGATVPNPTVPTLSPTEKEAPDADAPDATPAPSSEQLRLRLPKAASTDAVRAANAILGKKCNEAERAAINAGVPATPPAQQLWDSVLRAWKLRYERNKGLEGPLEWFAAGGPPAKRVNGAPQGGQYVQPITQQRNPGPAPLREPTPEEQAASEAEKARVRQQLQERHLAGRVARIGGTGMSTEVETDQEWRTVYGTKRVLFVEGRGVGDYYQAGDGVFRVRLWPHYRLQGGAEQLVLSKTLAETTLVEMFRWRKQDEAAG